MKRLLILIAVYIFLATNPAKAQSKNISPSAKDTAGNLAAQAGKMITTAKRIDTATIASKKNKTGLAEVNPTGTFKAGEKITTNKVAGTKMQKQYYTLSPSKDTTQQKIKRYSY